MSISKIGARIQTPIKNLIYYATGSVGYLFALSAHAADATNSPLPISTIEEGSSGQGIIQTFQNILDNEVITFIVIFFGIVICLGSLMGAYGAFKRYEDDEKLSKLIVSFIACAIFFVMSVALLYALYQIKQFGTSA